LSLRKVETSLPGVWEILPDLFQDDRGFFMETYHQAKFAALGIRDSFVQDNHSRSRQGTLRGLHYQVHHPQAKLCRVIEGQALDVAVDLRVGSPCFGRWVGVLLSAAKGNQVYIPPGFGHGFLALTDSVQLLYKCSEFYDPADERGIAWNDPDLAIDWNITAPLLSAKDAANPMLSAAPRELLPKFQAK
jgi:dTDP-4-dehydrorhamnose 3,5-epimerase